MSKNGPKDSARNRLRLKLGGTVLGLALATMLVVGLTSPSLAFAAAKPAVSHVRPASGYTSGGNTVTITGKNFMAGGKSKVKKVTFGTAVATKLHVRSATKLTVSAPKHAKGTVTVRVISKSGSKSAVVSAARYVYKTMPPAITSLVPATGPMAGGTTVTITGTGFTGATAVMFGALPATSFTVDSGTSITATSPAGGSTVALTIGVIVTTPAGTSAPTAADHYAYAAPPVVSSAPTVTAIDPATGPAAGGTTVTITGTNFTGATAVTFDATAATTFTVVSDTSITATTPAGIGIVDVFVTTPNGTSATSAADEFTFS